MAQPAIWWVAHKILVTSPKSRALGFDFWGFTTGLETRDLGLGLGPGLVNFDILLQSAGQSL